MIKHWRDLTAKAGIYQIEKVARAIKKALEDDNTRGCRQHESGNKNAQMENLWWEPLFSMHHSNWILWVLVNQSKITSQWREFVIAVPDNERIFMHRPRQTIEMENPTVH